MRQARGAYSKHPHWRGTAVSPTRSWLPEVRGCVRSDDTQTAQPGTVFCVGPGYSRCSEEFPELRSVHWELSSPSVHTPHARGSSLPLLSTAFCTRTRRSEDRVLATRPH